MVAQRMTLAIIRIGDVAGGLMIHTNYAVIALMKKSRMTHVLSTVSTVKASMSFPIERKDLAALGCPFPDDLEELCVECSHHSPIFGTCDLGIQQMPNV